MHSSCATIHRYSRAQNQESRAVSHIAGYNFDTICVSLFISIYIYFFGKYNFIFRRIHCVCSVSSVASLPPVLSLLANTRHSNPDLWAQDKRPLIGNHLICKLHYWRFSSTLLVVLKSFVLAIGLTNSGQSRVIRSFSHSNRQTHCQWHYRIWSSHAKALSNT